MWCLKLPRTLGADSPGTAGRESYHGGSIEGSVHVCGDLAKLEQNALNWKEKSCEGRASVTKLFLWLQVDLSFSPSEGLPSSDAHLQFQASPNSLCAVRAVDKSVLLMKPEADLSPASVRFWSVEKVRAWSEQEQPVLEWKQRALVRAVLLLVFLQWAKRWEMGSSCFLGVLCDFRDGN